MESPAADLPHPAAERLETLALYDALDHMPRIAKSCVALAGRDEGVPGKKRSDRVVPVEPQPVSELRARPQRCFEVLGAWWVSTVLHVVLLIGLLALAGWTAWFPSTDETSCAKGQGGAAQWRQLRRQQSQEVVHEMTIPIALPEGRSAQEWFGGDAGDTVPATTILLEISIDGDGNAHLVRARSAHVPDDRPLSLSCARIRVATSPAR